MKLSPSTTQPDKKEKSKKPKLGLNIAQVYLQATIEKGGTVTIPSLGITIAREEVLSKLN